MATPRPMRPTRRAATLAIAALLILPGLASADGVAADADTLTVGPQATIDLGQVVPSATLSLTVDFALSCAPTTSNRATTRPTCSNSTARKTTPC